MAGQEVSSRDLWQFITGTSLTKPKELVTQEISKNENKLKLGLQYYKPQTSPAGERLSKERKLDDNTTAFVKKLSQFLGLDELQCHDLYKLYTIREYRGSVADLQMALTVERHTQTLISRLRDYYHTERLYLLRSLKHILAYSHETAHPYHTQYTAFTNKVYTADTAVKQILEQYDKVCEEAAPTWETRGKLMNDRHCKVWIIQNLKEQCELLEILLIYYSRSSHSLKALLALAQKFKRNGFGRRQTNRHLLSENLEPLLSRIGFLQVMILVEGIDMEDLLAGHRNEKTSQHHVVSSNLFDSLDSYFDALGQAPEHGPLLLTWAALRELSSKGDEMKTAALGNRALQVKAFHYLTARLKAEPFCGKSVTARLCHSVTYGLLSCLLEAYHQDTLGDREGLQDLASVLLKQSVLAEDFWNVGCESGVGSLLQSSAACFPLDLSPLLELCTALAQAGADSAHKVNKYLQNLSIYTEVLTSSADVKATRGQHMWRLVRDRRPYHASGSDLVLRAGTQGEYQSVGSTGVVQWRTGYDTWDVCLAEVNQLLQQIAHGAGMVQLENLHRVTHVCRLVSALWTATPDLAHDTPQVAPLVSALYQVVTRFSQVAPPPLDLLAVCVQVIHRAAREQPLQAWMKLQQTGLLPQLTENVDNFAEVASGSGLSTGAYGTILAGTECTHGQYPLTIALLELVSDLTLPLSRQSRLDVLLPSVLTISREVFPVFGKWRYYNLTRREAIGQKCLEIFHRVLNVLLPDKETQQNAVSVREAVVYTLLYTEAGQALLDIVGTSVDTVNAALSSQGSATEGAGVELIQMIRMSFSVLNRVLLLRPSSSSSPAPTSPVELSLSAQTSSVGGQRNTTATIAQYIYHRHDPRLATLAVVLLKRLATMFPMSILACLGDEAEPIRDVFLSRLKADTEDIRLKVVILELLSSCVDTQPGLTEIFLNVKAITSSLGASSSDKKDDKKGADGDSPSKVSCLETVLSLIADKKQGTYECPSQLLCAAIEFIHALWHGCRETAMEALREKPGFWHCVCLSLTRELQSPAEADTDLQVLQREVSSCANIFKVLALELYNNQGEKLDENLKNVLSDILSNGRLLYWSKYLCDSMRWMSGQAEVLPPGELAQNSTLQLLCAWRNLLLVLGCVGRKVPDLLVPDQAKPALLTDLLTGVQCQMSADRDVSALNMKLAATASATYLTLLRHWISHVRSVPAVVLSLETILSQTLACCELLVPAVQIGLLGALTICLQHKAAEPLTEKHLASLVQITCSMLQQSTYQLPAPTAAPRTHTTTMTTTTTNPALQATNTSLSASVLSASHNTSLSASLLQHSQTLLSESKVKDVSRLQAPREGQGESQEETSNQQLQRDVEVKLKLQTSCICLLEALIVALPSPQYWLPEVKQHSILHNLLSSTETWIQARQGEDYVQTVMSFFLTLTRHPQSAESLAVSSFIQQLCLILSQLYSGPEAVTPGNTGQACKAPGPSSLSPPPTWSAIYCHSITLYTALLSTLRYNFLHYALEFVGVHQDRMTQCLERAGTVLHADILREAEETCRFLCELSVYRREWRLQLPAVLQALMGGVCHVLHRCVSLLIRPNLLQHMLEKQRSGQEVQLIAQDKFLTAPLIRSMSQQPSDDADTASTEVLGVQNRLLGITCQSVLALRRFSPDLCELLLDQSVDVSEYPAVLALAFSTPSLDADTQPSYGTLVSCISLCLFMLNKLDVRGPSGTPPPKQDNKPPIERSLVMFVLETTLYLIMSQALRCMKDPDLSTRDKQLLKRELSAELNSFLSGMQRYLRRGGASHTPSTLGPAPGASQGPHTSETSYLKLVDVFVRKVLR